MTLEEVRQSVPDELRVTPDLLPTEIAAAFAYGF
jgi:hypothetical protein